MFEGEGLEEGKGMHNEKFFFRKLCSIVMGFISNLKLTRRAVFGATFYQEKDKSVTKKIRTSRP